jgi:hypothetical protein
VSDLEAPLPYHPSFSNQEFDVIRRGLEPQAMEDKWRIHMEGDWLHFHRSWTGLRIYRLRFSRRGDRHEVVETLVIDGSEDYRRNTDEYEAALLDFLIRGLMLQQDVTFPLPADLDAAEDIFQHHIAGTGYPSRRLGTTWWSRAKASFEDLLAIDVTAWARGDKARLPEPAPDTRVSAKQRVPNDDFGLVFESTIERGPVAGTCFVCGSPRSHPAGTPRLACGSCHARARLPDTGALIRDLIKPPNEGDFPLEGSTLSFLFSPVMIDDRRGAIESVAGGWGVHEEVYFCDNHFDYRLRHYEPHASKLGQIRARELRERFEALGPREFVRTVYIGMPDRARSTFDMLSAWYALSTYCRRVRDRRPLRTNRDVIEAAAQVHAMHAESEASIGPTDMFRRIEALQAQS